MATKAELEKKLATMKAQFELQRANLEKARKRADESENKRIEAMRLRDKAVAELTRTKQAFQTMTDVVKTLTNPDPYAYRGN